MKFVHCINKCWEWIKKSVSSIAEWLGIDGLLHLETSILMMVILGVWLNWCTSALIVISLGLFKESYDWGRSGYPEWHDIQCDALGVLFGIGLLFLYSI